MLAWIKKTTLCKCSQSYLILQHNWVTACICKADFTCLPCTLTRILSPILNTQKRMSHRPVLRSWTWSTELGGRDGLCCVLGALRGPLGPGSAGAGQALALSRSAHHASRLMLTVAARPSCSQLWRPCSRFTCGLSRGPQVFFSFLPH